MKETFASRLAMAARETEATLERFLGDEALPDEAERPPRLLAAMRHAALAGGKRIRPFLMVESARLFEAETDAVLEAAAALECVHCYSLAHDDLPAMDDDDLRRGRPAVHKAFDEATAILAGDALLTLAFDILAGINAEPAVKIELVSGLARAAGVGGMAGGQMLDIAAEGNRLDESATSVLQAMKTGALIRYACEAGAILGRADAPSRERLVAFGRRIGLAFQLSDDLIDATGDAATAGKATGKDSGSGKATLVAIHGVERARAILDVTITEAIANLAPFGDRAEILVETARFIAGRKT